jgi:N-ethylmaleimide reductase
MKAKLYTRSGFGSVTLKNRVFMAPLTRCRATEDGEPGDCASLYYSQRASAGLIVTEATQISPMGKGYINTPAIHTRTQVDRWRRVVNAVHEKDGVIFLQLWHVGRISHSSLLPDNASPLAPSAIRANSSTFTKSGSTAVSVPVAITIEQITTTLSDYVNAALNAKEAGFDGVEIHAANGYLIDQFLRTGTNRRTDSYGGPARNRVRFLSEVVEAVLRIWEPDRVGVRISPTVAFNDMHDDDPPETFGTTVEMLNPYALGYLHVVEAAQERADLSEADRALFGSLRSHWKAFDVANGNYDRHRAEEAVENGSADAVAFGRLFLANPDLPRRLLSRASLNDPDPSTFYSGGCAGYTDYPFI